MPLFALYRYQSQDRVHPAGAGLAAVPQIRQSGLQAGEQHHGGCVLFERQAEVESLLLQSALRPSLQLTNELAGTDKWQAVEEQ